VGVLAFPRFAEGGALHHGVSTRRGGVGQGPWSSLNLSFKVGEDPVIVLENRRLLSASLGLDLARAVHLDQVHGDRVLSLDAANRPRPGEPLGEGDALITREAGIPLMIQVADCLPVLFHDPVHQAVGLAHAGWRGTVSHVAVKALLAMKEAYGTRPEEVKALLGPCIGPCCYEVGEEVRGEFEAVFPWSGEILREGFPGRWMLDLAEANARQLLEIGVAEGNLVRSGLCTVGNLEHFFSHRAEASKDRPTGRFGAFLMLNG
jgi:YfiH family protein